MKTTLILMLFLGHGDVSVNEVTSFESAKECSEQLNNVLSDHGTWAARFNIAYHEGIRAVYTCQTVS